MVQGRATEDARLEMVDAHRAAVDGVAQVVKALQALPEDVRYLKDRIVSNLLWVVTEFNPGAKHKIHGVRWRTRAAHQLAMATDTRTIRHEHVVERRWMLEFLHEHPDVIEEALWNYPACLVTIREHAALGATRAWGWRRYVSAGVEVIDGESGAALELSVADRTPREKYIAMGADVSDLRG